VLPSVRGRRRHFTAAVLLAALAVGALGSFLAAHLAAALAARFGGLQVTDRPRVAATAVALALLADVAGLRPPAVHRQVPQGWGHRYGPVAAAARYGLRLGVGPATILTTWLWWSTFAIVVVSGRRVAVISALCFAGSRFLTMWSVAWRVDDGVHMAKRITRWRSRERQVQCAGWALLAVVAALAGTGVFAG
jgi:hypothetical protein